MTTKHLHDALFVYGSLLEETTRQRILGHRVETIEARLHGFARRKARYYYIVRAEGSETVGMVMLGLTSEDWPRLDAYEEVPRLYTREEVGRDIRRSAAMLGLPSYAKLHLPVGRIFSEDVGLARCFWLCFVEFEVRLFAMSHRAPSAS